MFEGNLAPFIELLSGEVVVELLWRLRSHSLGQSEDQAERVSSQLFYFPFIYIKGYSSINPSL
jgi:hypothetical protein